MPDTQSSLFLACMLRCMLYIVKHVSIMRDVTLDPGHKHQPQARCMTGQDRTVKTVCAVRKTYDLSLQIYSAPIMETFETKLLDQKGGLWAFKNWFTRTALRCFYIFLAAFFAAMFPYFGDILGKYLAAVFPMLW